MIFLELRYLRRVVAFKLLYARSEVRDFFFVLLGSRTRREVGDDVVDVFDAAHRGSLTQNTARRQP